MPENKLANNKISTSTQQYLDIAEIKDDAVIMKDGTLRAVILVSSINFALKSEDEQNAIISAYVDFLNNISSMIQIVIQSRELDINGYLQYLKKKEKEQTNRLLKIQTGEYINYIQELTSIGKIMNKFFYIVIPYSPFSDKRKSFFQLLSEAFSPAKIIKLKGEKFERYKESLQRIVDSVSGGLESMGVSTQRLDTQSLIELFYRSYNPETSKHEVLTDISRLRVDK